MLRTSTERPEALDKGIFVLAGIDGKSLLQAVDTAVEMNRNEDDGLPVPNYTDENVSAKVVKLIQSYTGVVNKMVWRNSDCWDEHSFFDNIPYQWLGRAWHLYGPDA